MSRIIHMCLIMNEIEWVVWYWWCRLLSCYKCLRRWQYSYIPVISLMIQSYHGMKYANTQNKLVTGFYQAVSHHLVKIYFWVGNRSINTYVCDRIIHSHRLIKPVTGLFWSYGFVWYKIDYLYVYICAQRIGGCNNANELFIMNIYNTRICVDICRCLLVRRTSHEPGFGCGVYYVLLSQLVKVQ